MAVDLVRLLKHIQQSSIAIEDNALQLKFIENFQQSLPHLQTQLHWALRFLISLHRLAWPAPSLHQLALSIAGNKGAWLHNIPAEQVFDLLLESGQGKWTQELVDILVQMVALVPDRSAQLVDRLVEIEK